MHVVGLGWLLTSIAERRRVDEREEVARPIGPDKDGVAGGDAVGRAEAQDVGEAVEGVAAGGARRSGRSRVAVKVEAEPQADEDDEKPTKGKAKLKRERTPSVKQQETFGELGEEGEEDQPLLVTATTNAPHARFAATHPGEHHLLEYDNAPCSATLNLTDLKKNSNKVSQTALSSLVDRRLMRRLFAVLHRPSDRVIAHHRPTRILHLPPLGPDRRARPGQHARTVQHEPRGSRDVLDQGEHLSKLLDSRNEANCDCCCSNPVRGQDQP